MQTSTHTQWWSLPSTLYPQILYNKHSIQGRINLFVKWEVDFYFQKASLPKSAPPLPVTICNAHWSSPCSVNEYVKLQFTISILNEWISIYLKKFFNLFSTNSPSLLKQLLSERDCKCNFKWHSLQRWQCPILNLNLIKNLILSFF